jgi:hypothetical protein
MLDSTNIFSKFPRIVSSVQHISVFYVYKWMEIASTYLSSRKLSIGIPNSSLKYFNIGIIDFLSRKIYNMHFPVGKKQFMHKIYSYRGAFITWNIQYDLILANDFSVSNNVTLEKRNKIYFPRLDIYGISHSVRH